MEGLQALNVAPWGVTLPSLIQTAFEVLSFGYFVFLTNNQDSLKRRQFSKSIRSSFYDPRS